MLSTFLLFSLVSSNAAQDNKLEISNVRATYGHLGAIRPLGKGILPGDVAHFTFDIKNLKHDDKGQVAYSSAIEIRDADGNLFYKQEPYNAVAQNFFGGSSLPCSARLEIPLDAKPGAYSWKVTIQDRLAQTSVTTTGKGQVHEPGFGIVRVGTYADAEGKAPVHPIGVVGSTLYVNFSMVGFARDKKTKQPDLSVEMKITDENGKITSVKPITGSIKSDIEADRKIIPLAYALTLNHPGRYTIQLNARCEVCGASSTVSLPVRILSFLE